MEDLISNLGVPSIILILLIREIAPILKGRNGNKNGSKCRPIGECEQIVRRLDSRLDDGERRFDKVDTKLDHIETLIVNNK